MKRAFLLLAAWGFLSGSAFAKSKSVEAFEAPAADPSVVLEFQTESEWETSTAGTPDWTLASSQPRASLDAEVLIPWGQDPLPSVLLQVASELRASTRNPTGASSSLSFELSKGRVLLGSRLELLPDWLVDLVVGVDTVTDFASDDAFRPYGADPAAFWTRLMPRWGLSTQAKLNWEAWRWGVEALVLGGKDAESAWGRKWPDLLDLEASTSLRYRLTLGGDRQMDFGLATKASWSSGILSAVWKDQESVELKVDWGKRLSWELIPFAQKGKRWGTDPYQTRGEWSSSLRVAPRDRSLQWGISGRYYPTSAISLSLSFREEF